MHLGGAVEIEVVGVDSSVGAGAFTLGVGLGFCRGAGGSCILVLDWALLF